VAGETYNGWTKKFLSALGAPATHDNLVCIYAVIQSESTSIHWNPLAITGAGVPGNSVGVGNFDDEVTGIAATVNFLSANGPQNYPGNIVHPLQTGNGQQAFAGFVHTGAWTGILNSRWSDIWYRDYDDAHLQAAVGSSPLLADPGHGEGDIGAVQDITPVPTISTVFDAVNSLIGTFTDVAHFFAILGKGETWVRIGEVVGALFLFAIAVKMVNDDIGVFAAGSGTLKRVAAVAAL